MRFHSQPLKRENRSVTTKDADEAGTDCVVLRTPDAAVASMNRIGIHLLMSCSYNHD
jgi:hypothetical protein